MNATIVKEATDILKRLSPETHAYLHDFGESGGSCGKQVRASAAAKHLCEPSGLCNGEPRTGKRDSSRMYSTATQVPDVKGGNTTEK